MAYTLTAYIGFGLYSNGPYGNRHGGMQHISYGNKVSYGNILVMTLIVIATAVCNMLVMATYWLWQHISNGPYGNRHGGMQHISYGNILVMATY